MKSSMRAHARPLSCGREVWAHLESMNLPGEQRLGEMPFCLDISARDSFKWIRWVDKVDSGLQSIQHEFAAVGMSYLAGLVDDSLTRDPG